MQRVKQRWAAWYSGERRPGRHQEIKSSCNLANNLGKLEAGKSELQANEEKFNQLEKLLRQTYELELTINELGRQLKSRDAEQLVLREKREQSTARFAARQKAEENSTGALKEKEGALEEQRLRVEAAQRGWDDENS